jgi:predicted nucleotidyltransferase
MKNTFSTLLKPLNPDKVETLQRLYTATETIPVVLLGAFARDLLFYHLHGVEVPRATKDIDTSVQMKSWENFNAICRKLLELGFHIKKPNHPEKFTDTNGQEVDMLPFGSLSEDGKTITWPADNSPWTISGIQEAYDHALLFRQAAFEFRIIPPAAMIYLKIFSTCDRPRDRKKKDSADINFVLTNYLTATGKGRLKSSGSDGDIMEKVKGDLERAAAWLAGRDMAGIVSAQTAGDLLGLLRKETEGTSLCPIAHELANYHEGKFARSREILKSLRDGFEEARK